MKLTKWFPRGVSPVHEGPYETTELGDYSKTFQFWNGKKWGAMAFTPAQSFGGRESPTVRKNPRWRGLAEKP